MKFVLSLPLARSGMEMMEKLGIQWEVGPGLNWEEYPDALLESADALIVRLEKCPESVLRRCPNLKVLGRPGMGFENVPVDYCTKRGIPVVLAPGANARSVAEHALALIFACAKDLKEMDNENRKGNWGIRAQGKQMELAGKPVGIVGVGGIGGLLAHLCRALGMDCLAGAIPGTGPGWRKRAAGMGTPWRKCSGKVISCPSMYLCWKRPGISSEPGNWP